MYICVFVYAIKWQAYKSTIFRKNKMLVYFIQNLIAHENLKHYKTPIAEFYTKSFGGKSFIVNWPLPKLNTITDTSVLSLLNKIREKYKRKVKYIGIIVSIWKLRI